MRTKAPRATSYDRNSETAGADMKAGQPEQQSVLPPYVLVTPSRNEEAFIEKTIESVIHQTVLPVKWVIVNDGSTDRTGTVAEALCLAIRLDRSGQSSRAAGA